MERSEKAKEQTESFGFCGLLLLQLRCCCCARVCCREKRKKENKPPVCLSPVAGGLENLSGLRTQRVLAVERTKPHGCGCTPEDLELRAC